MDEPQDIEVSSRPENEAVFALQALISPVVADVILGNANRRDTDFATAVRAIVLCADLSGFSVAGAKLTRSNERGAEELRGIVNTVFGRVTEAIRSGGGQILQFSGDAVMAAWPYDDDPVDQTLCATSAGLALQAACRALSVPEMHDLKMRVTLAKGSIWIVHLAGNAEGREAIICGDVFKTFGTEDRFHEGVLLDQPLWEEVAKSVLPRVTLATSPGGVRVLALNGTVRTIPHSSSRASSEMAVIASYVPEYLRKMLDSVANDWLAEFRSTQILFARFPGLQFGGADDLGTLAKLAAQLDHAIEGNGGVRLKLGTDDKGLILLAAWGLQSRSFEDNAERALVAAAKVQEAAFGAGLTASIGVTGGKVFAGLVGSDYLMEFTIIGDAVNRAAALSDGATGLTRVDAYTQVNGAKRFNFSDAGMFTLKGQEAANHFIVQSEATGHADLGANHHGELIGRAAERAQLDQLVVEILASTASDLIHIVGDAGLGKSRLASYLQTRLIRAGITPFRINADSLRRTTGYYPWRQLIEALVGPAPTIEDMAGLVGSDPAMTDLIPLLSPVLRTAIPDTEFTAKLFGGGRAEKTQVVIIALLERLIGLASAVVIVEDAHWFDSASWQLLERFSRAIPQVTIVLVSRHLELDSLPTEARRLLGRPDAKLISLMPLSREDSAALVNASLGLIDCAPAIVELIYHHAEGHPLFTSVLSMSLRDQGLLRIEGGYAHLRLGEKGMSQIVFPDGVEGVVAERIASLTPAQQLTLKVAAVLGRTFELDLLSRIHPGGTSTSTLALEIAAAQRAGLIETVDLDTGKYRFHHAIIGDTAYKMLVSDQRRMLHSKTAVILNALGAANGYPAASLALLSHHFEQAEQHEQAVDFLSRAAESARSGYNNAEVVDFLTRALNIVESQPQLANIVTRGNWNHKIAEALKALGHYQRAADFLFESARLLDRAPPTTTRAALVSAMGSFAGYRLRPHRVAQPAVTRDPMIAAAEINMTLSEIHYELNKVPFSLAEVLRGVNLARSGGGDSTTLAKIYMGMALISRALPWALNGNDLQEKSIDIAERLHDLTTISWVYMASGVFEMGKCGWVTGEAHFQRSMQVSELCGERKNWETAMSSLGNLKRVEGWFDQAMACSNATLAAARDRDISHSIAWSHNGRLRDLLCLNRLDEAREDCRILNQILNDPKKKGDTNDNSNVVDGYARALLALVDGNLTLAHVGLNDAISVVQGMNRPQVYMVQNTSFLCDVVWNLWRQSGDKSLLTQSAVIAKSGRRMAKQYRAGGPSAALAAGDFAWYRGKRDIAAKNWRASAQAASERGMLFAQAQALYRLNETDYPSTNDSGPDWRSLLAQLGIARPTIWSIALG